MSEAATTKREERLSARVAFASADGHHVNQHFGSARRFVLYDLGTGEPNQILDEAFSAEAQDGNEDKLVAKLKFLKDQDVDVLVCAQVGQSAAKQLLSAGIQPMAVDEKPEIPAVIERIHEDLVLPGARWTKRLKKGQSREDDRLKTLLDEDWEA